MDNVNVVVLKIPTKKAHQGDLAENKTLGANVGGDNILPFSKEEKAAATAPGTESNADADNRPDTPIENVIAALATREFNRKDADAIYKFIILQSHARGLKLLQDDVRKVTDKDAAIELFSILYTLKGPKGKVFALEADINAFEPASPAIN